MRAGAYVLQVVTVFKRIQTSSHSFQDKDDVLICRFPCDLENFNFQQLKDTEGLYQNV